jgi:hypothetical protein
MSPDPIMQAPYWSQGQNRYSYVFNDPINFTDPSGFEAEAGGAGLMGGLMVGGLVNVGLQSGLITAGGLGVGLIGGALNVTMTSLVSPFRGSEGGTYQVPSTATAAATTTGSKHAPVAVAQNRPPGPLTMPDRPPGSSLFDPEREALACVGPLKQACARVLEGAARSPAGQWAQRHAAQLGPRILDLLRRAGSRAATTPAPAPAAGMARAVPNAPNVATVIDPNKLHHIFGQAKHKLGPLLEKFGGSQEATFRAVENATQKAVGPQGLQDVFETTVKLGDQTVGVSGRVIDGTARIGSFWIP